MADAAQLERIADVAETLAGRLAAEPQPLAPDGFAAAARGIPGGARMRVELLSIAGNVLATAGADAADAPRAAAADAVVAEARWGRIARGSSYDAMTARRVLEVAAPVETGPGQIVGVVRVMADTRDADAELTQVQRLMLGGFLGWTAAALLAAWIVAGRLARPVADLSAAASRLAEGDVEAPIPPAESAELASFADAIVALREQLVERGLTIGRQDTRQEAVLASMIEGVLAVDGRQRVVGMNRAAAELLGVDPGRVSRRPLQEVIRNPDLRRFALRAIDCREPVEDDLVLPGPRDRTIRLRGTALRDMSGEGGAVIVLNDVTEVKRLENVRRDFVANVSHELKTPIASIKGFVETLLDGAAEDPADRRRFLDIVARQADRLESIIEDLLALSRIEQSEGAGNLPREPVPVAEVLAAVEADCRPRAADRSIRLEVSCPDDLVAEVNAPLLEQAVINLVDNAIMYSEPGRTVRLAAEAGTGEGPQRELRIVVADQGCGIDADHLPRLFERFYRVDKARSRKLGGTGLGLSIVKHIVQAHDGTVAVESEPGVGSTFTIRLPLGAAEAAAVRSRTA
jgi:two-component system phosphate regulon sensor histidine kinase PhoR